MTFRKYLWRVSLILSAGWVLFTLFLDIRYEMFPATTLGGLKVLAFCLILPIGFALISYLVGLRRGNSRS